MKKVVLICLAVTTCFTAFSQGRLARPDLSRSPVFYGRTSVEIDENKSDRNFTPYAIEKKYVSTNSVQSVVTLGTSSNALTAWGIRHCLWADPMLNTVLFTRRAMGMDTGVINSGRLFYDISFDGGLTFDTGRGPVYTPSNSTVLNPSNARHPQAAIYNPAGTTNPMDAYMTYYAASQNNTNPSVSIAPFPQWGGNVYGSHKLNLATPPTQHELVSDSIAGAWYVIPELMHMCKNGNTYVLSQSQYGNSDIVIGRGVPYDYMDTMILEKGIWDTASNDYNYSRQLIPIPAGLVPYNRWYYHPFVPVTNTDPVSTMLNSGIVFNDNGQVGYMVFKEFLNTSHSPDTTEMLYVYKSIDGGTTWNRTHLPQLDYVDRLCQDSGFSMGIAGEVFDVAMDANNNLHIVIVVGSKYMDPNPQLGTSVYYKENYGGLFDILTIDGGVTWFAHKLKTDPIEEIYGVMGDPATPSNNRVYDNRPQISRSYDGTKLFFSWFETDTTSWVPNWANNGYDNQHPDMHLVGYDVNTSLWTPEMNTTAFPALNGDADGACWLGSVAYYALDNGSGGHKIPTVIGTPTATSTNNNPDFLSPFTFKYLDGIEVPGGAYLFPNVSAGFPNPNHVLLNYINKSNDIKSVNDFVVSPVKPNPAFGKSELIVQIVKPGDIKLEIRNLFGQVVYSEIYLQQSGGLHPYSIDTGNLDSGFYLCTVTFDGRQSTQRIAVH